MHSRLADIHHTLDSIKKQAEVMPIQHIPSKENITDIATRSETSLSMLGPDSLWQTGPNWLSLPRQQWPASRSFAKEEFPDNECKNPIRILLLTTQNISLRCPIVSNALNMCNDYYDALRKVTKNLLDICPKLVSQRSSHALVQTPTLTNSEASHRAWSLLFEDAMSETDLLFSQGKLRNF